jgi:hypothetical protein
MVVFDLPKVGNTVPHWLAGSKVPNAGRPLRNGHAKKVTLCRRVREKLHHLDTTTRPDLDSAKPNTVICLSRALKYLSTSLEMGG